MPGYRTRRGSSSPALQPGQASPGTPSAIAAEISTAQTCLYREAVLALCLPGKGLLLGSLLGKACSSFVSISYNNDCCHPSLWAVAALGFEGL